METDVSLHLGLTLRSVHLSRHLVFIWQRSGVPSTLTLKKVTLSDDDQLDYIHSSTSSSDAHELPLDRNGRFVVGEEDDDLLQWSLEYEVGDDSCSREKVRGDTQPGCARSF